MTITSIEPRNGAILAARAADEKKAEDIRVLDVSELIGILDFFVIASGVNERQVATIAGAVEEALREEGMRVLRREGEREGRWVLLDFGDLVLHVFAQEERQFYELERLWKDAPAVPWSDESLVTGAPSGSSSTGATGTASS